MRTGQAWLVSGVMVALMTIGAAAQTATPPAQTTTTPPPSGQTMRVGGWVYDIDGQEPVIAYVVGRSRVLDGTTTVTVELLVQTTDGWRALPPYEVHAVGAFSEAQPGDALVLSREVANGG